MSSELRTLKDLEDDWESHKIYNQECDNVEAHVEITPELIFYSIRQESIKWYKHLEETKEDNVFDFLETFFNITEEDLKN